MSLAVYNGDPVERSESVARAVNMAQSMQELGVVEIRYSMAVQKGWGAAGDVWNLQDAEKTILIYQNRLNWFHTAEHLPLF